MSFNQQPQMGMFSPQSPYMMQPQNFPFGVEPQMQGEQFHQPQLQHGQSHHGQSNQQISRLERRVNKLEHEVEQMDKRLKRLEKGSSQSPGHNHGHPQYFQPRNTYIDPNAY